MIKLKITSYCSPWATYGILTDSERGRLCDTLELPYISNETNVSCIPDGIYTLTPRTSNRFGHHLILTGISSNGDMVTDGEQIPPVDQMVENPGIKRHVREYILIHAGNTTRDTAGCILPGTFTDVPRVPTVRDSRSALKRLLDHIGDKPCILEIVRHQLNGVH